MAPFGASEIGKAATEVIEQSAKDITEQGGAIKDSGRGIRDIPEPTAVQSEYPDRFVDTGRVELPDISKVPEINPEIDPKDLPDVDVVYAKKGMDPADNNNLESNDSQKQQEYKDDNGKVYRQGDTLSPNNTFEVNGYTYTTDDQGRVISAEGNLKQGDPSTQRDMDDMSAVGKGDQQEGDHRGHLIGHRFDGSGGIENLVPMDAKLNQGDYKKLENTLAKALENGSEVTVKVEPVYEGDSNRPTSIKVTYTVDGEKETVVFKNEGGEKNDK